MSPLAWLLLALFAGTLLPDHSLGLTVHTAAPGARPSVVTTIPSTTRHPLDATSTPAPSGVQGGGPS